MPLTIRLASPFTKEYINHIKICALYFDKIEIQKRYIFAAEKETRDNFIFKGEIPILDKKFEEYIAPLSKEGIVSVINHGENRNKILSNINKILNIKKESGPLINLKQSSNPSTLNKEAAEILKHYAGNIHKGDYISSQFFDIYYSGLLLNCMESIDEGKTTISSSKIISEALIPVVKSAPELLKKSLDNKLAIEAISISLIDVSSLHFEHILELRLKLKDELLAFRESFEEIQFELRNSYSTQQILNEGDKIISLKLRPLLIDLENKSKNSKYKVFKNLLDVLKNPGSYVPLLGSSVAGIPIELASLISLGLVSGEVALEWFNENSNKNVNNLTYLLKLKNTNLKNNFTTKPSNSNQFIHRPLIISPPKNTIYTWPETVERII